MVRSAREVDRKKRRGAMAAWRGGVSKEAALAVVSEYMREGRVLRQRIQPEGLLFYVNQGTPIGCVLGTLGSSKEPLIDYAQSETLLGIPAPLAELVDRIYASLPWREAKQWPERILEAIPEGKLLRPKMEAWLAWLISDPDGPLAETLTDSAASDCYVKREAGEDVAEKEWAAAKEQALKRAFACTDGLSKKTDKSEQLALWALHHAWMACAQAMVYETGQIDRIAAVADTVLVFGAARAKARSDGQDEDAPGIAATAFAKAMADQLVGCVRRGRVGLLPERQNHAVLQP